MPTTTSSGTAVALDLRPLVAAVPWTSRSPHASASASTLSTPRCLVTRSFSSRSRCSAGRDLSADVFGGASSASSELNRGVENTSLDRRLFNAVSICGGQEESVT